MFERLENKITEMERAIFRLEDDIRAIRGELENARREAGRIQASQTAAQNNTARCARCGAPLEKNALFCTNCGLRIAPVPATPIPDAPVNVSAPAPSVPAAPSPAPAMTPHGVDLPRKNETKAMYEPNISEMMTSVPEMPKETYTPVALQPGFGSGTPTETDTPEPAVEDTRNETPTEAVAEETPAEASVEETPVEAAGGQAADQTGEPEFCTHCGTELEPGSIYCSECGTRVPM